MRQGRCALLLQTKDDLRLPICYYCRSNFAPGEEVINRDQRLYHRNCYKRLFTLTSKCLTCVKAEECLGQDNENRYAQVSDLR